VLLDEQHHTVRFEHPGMRIDLGGIGKGYAVDHGVAILKARGIQHAVVSAGGDSRILGDHMGRPWLVAIRHPDDPKKVVTRIPLSDSAMSTSGDYERYFDEKGVRYHHIIDPRTGHSASKVRSATILAPTATQTDGMSKTASCSVLKKRSRSSTACLSTMRSSCAPTGACCTRTGCGRRCRDPRAPLRPRLLRRAPV